MRAFQGTLREGDRVVAERVVGTCYQDACQDHNLSGSALCPGTPSLVLGRQYSLTVDCGKIFTLSPTHVATTPGATLITFNTSTESCRSCRIGHTV